MSVRAFAQEFDINLATGKVSEESDLGFITNPKNGRVKGLNEVSLDRTYY